MNTELTRSYAFRRRSHREMGVEDMEAELDAIIKTLRTGLTEMRQQDDNFNRRLGQMKKDIDDVSSACWRHKVPRLTENSEKPVELTSCSLEVEAGSCLSQEEESVSSGEFLPIASTTTSVKLRRSRSPLMRLELSHTPTLPPMNHNADRSASVSPVGTTSRIPSAELFNPKRASMDSLLIPALHKQHSIRSLPSSAKLQNSHASVRQVVSNASEKKTGQSSQRRGSLGSWLLRKFQHS